MSVATFRTVFASIPDGPVEEFFRGMRLAGWEPDEDVVSTPSSTSS
jgi:hypothetical protein